MLVETVLILFIIYILLAKRSKAPAELDKLKLNSEWPARMPTRMPSFRTGSRNFDTLTLPA